MGGPRARGCAQGEAVTHNSAFLSLALLGVALIIPVTEADGQDPVPEGQAQDPVPASPTSVPRVFFDCRGPRCDNRYNRTEIGWVAWVRDQRDAHVHIIMTS